MPFFKKDLGVLGIEINDLSNLEKALTTVVGKVFAVKKLTKNGRSNVYLNQCLGVARAPQPAPTTGESSQTVLF